MENLLLLVCLLKKETKQNPTTIPKQQQKFPLGRSILRREKKKKKKKNQAPHAHSRKIVGCFTLLECFTKLLTSPYGTKCHSSS